MDNKLPTTMPQLLQQLRRQIEEKASILRQKMNMMLGYIDEADRAHELIALTIAEDPPVEIVIQCGEHKVSIDTDMLDNTKSLQDILSQIRDYNIQRAKDCL